MFTPTLVIIYVVGVIVGLLRVDGKPAAKLAVALLWPLGVAAGMITLSVLLLAAMVLFPMLGLIVVAGIAVAWVVAAGW